MADTVDVTIPVEPAAAATLADARNREAVGRLISRVLRPRSGPSPPAEAIAEMKADAKAAGLTDAEIDAELGMLQANFAQNPANDDEQRAVIERYANEDDTVVEELPRLREELARLANVNLNAEADRDELAAREAFLREQLEDLGKARATLLATIKEIEASCQDQFNETFEAVRASFEEMFARLFPGGAAKMWQTDPDNLSETGIEIAVQPPGKKMTALQALSGGERAMTAAALIFALHPVHIECVAWISAASDSMVTMFFALAFGAFFLPFLTEPFSRAMSARSSAASRKF